MNIIHGTGPRIRGISPLEDFNTNTVQVPSVVGGSNGTLTVNDVTYTIKVGTVSVNLFRLDVSESSYKPGKSFVSVTPAVCTVDSTGQVSRVSDGLCEIDVVTPVGTRRYSQQIVTSGSTTIKDGVSALAAGSLLKYLTDQRNALLAAVAPVAANQRAYVNGDGSGGLNASNMLLRSDVAGWTATPFSHLFTNWRYISARHSIHTAHVLGVGPFNRYYTNTDGSNVMSWTPTTDLVVGGVVQRRTDYGKVISPDTAIVYQPTANATTLTKLPPANLASYLPTSGEWLVDAPVWFKRHNSAQAGEGHWVQAASLNTDANVRVPTSAAPKTFCDFAETIAFTGGDSGTPIFMCVNGEAVLVYSLTSGWGGGYSYAGLNSAINTAMNELSAQYVAAGGVDAGNGSYAAATVSLSGFNLY